MRKVLQLSGSMSNFDKALLLLGLIESLLTGKCRRTDAIAEEVLQCRHDVQALIYASVIWTCQDRQHYRNLTFPMPDMKPLQTPWPKLMPRTTAGAVNQAVCLRSAAQEDVGDADPDALARLEDHWLRFMV